MKGFNVVFEVENENVAHVRKLHVDVTNDCTEADVVAFVTALNPAAKIKSIDGRPYRPQLIEHDLDSMSDRFHDEAVALHSPTPPSPGSEESSENGVGDEEHNR